MAHIIMKMSPEAQRLYKSDYGTQWRKYLYPEGRTDSEGNVTQEPLSSGQLAMLAGLGIVFRGFEGIDNLVLGHFEPSKMTDTPYIVPTFFDAMPDDSKIWQILERMADEYDAAKAACTPLPPPPPDKIRKNVTVIVPGLDDSE